MGGPPPSPLQLPQHLISCVSSLQESHRFSSSASNSRSVKPVEVAVRLINGQPALRPKLLLLLQQRPRLKHHVGSDSADASRSYFKFNFNFV